MSYIWGLRFTLEILILIANIAIMVERFTRETLPSQALLSVGLLILCSVLGISLILSPPTTMSFLERHWGRAAIYLFVGLITLEPGNKDVQIAVGSLTIIFSFGLAILSCLNPHPLALFSVNSTAVPERHPPKSIGVELPPAEAVPAQSSPIRSNPFI